MEVLRNVTHTEDISDAIVLNDGSEEPLVSSSPHPNAPLVMKMRVSVLLFSRSASVSAIHAQIIDAVSSDAGVQASFGNTGQLHYDGCEAGFSTAERVYCTLAVYFEVTYNCNPGKILTTYRRYTILDAIEAALATIT